MKLTILIVDDTPANIYALKELLEKKDRMLLTAGNGKDALKIALDNIIDLIILDVHMPDMDGFEVAKILRSNKKTKNIPIIFATAEKKEHESILKGFEEGAIDYLFKPLDPEITKAKVAVLLKIQIQQKELVEKNKELKKASEEIRRLNTDLTQNIVQLEVANKEMESFSYSISHDLRAPLRALSAYSRIMTEDYTDKLDDEGKTLLHSIEENSVKMSTMIDNLLELSRLGRKEIQKSLIDMDTLVEHCIRDINSSIQHHAKIKIHSLIPAKADYSLLSHVWTNLISNAIKYSGKKEAPEIEIGSNRSGDQIVYWVKDNGVGFDMAYVDKLFGVFQRLHRKEEFDGVGIGLAIVDRIITKHGGKVWAEAKVNEGATIYFSLPCMD